MAYFQNFLTQYEGVEELSNDNNDITEAEQLLMKMEIENEDHDHFFTEYGEINGP